LTPCIGLLLIQRRIDFPGLARIDDAADGGDLLRDVGRHLRQGLAGHGHAKAGGVAMEIG
jgi:hypothetical protein